MAAVALYVKVTIMLIPNEFALRVTTPVTQRAR